MIQNTNCIVSYTLKHRAAIHSLLIIYKGFIVKSFEN